MLVTAKKMLMIVMFYILQVPVQIYIINAYF